MRRIIALSFLLLITASSFSQSKREWTEYGDAAYKNGDYKTAVTFYLKVVDKGTSVDITRPYEIKPYVPHPKKSKDSLKTAVKDTSMKATADPAEQYVIHQIADCYRLNHDYANAEIWFKTSMDNKPAAYPFERYWYADALMKNERYPGAAFQFEQVMTDSEGKDSVIFQQAKLKIAGCYLATDTSNTKDGVKLTYQDSIFNTGTASFAVNYYGDASTIQFTAAREGGTVTDPKKQDSKFICDIYTLTKGPNGWTGIQKVSGPVDTDTHEGAGFLTLDRSNYFFTRWSTVNKNECSIYLCKLLNDKWLSAEKLNDNINLAGYKTMQPALSPDGSVLYFSSNRPGGFGKMDLWYVNLDDDSRPTGPPINMGPLFNTPGDEVTPFLHY